MPLTRCLPTMSPLPNMMKSFPLGTEAVFLAPVMRWRSDHWLNEEDYLTVETPVALEFNGISHAVMLATPCDLEQFALGFALSEGIVPDPSAFYGAQVETGDEGITVHCDISGQAFLKLNDRRRNMTGRTGCGLCGVDSLAQVFRPIADLSTQNPPSLHHRALRAALKNISALQPVNRLTGGMHAAAWSGLDGGLLHVCEDVGRHNALDKLIGVLAEQGLDFQAGFLLITSRASVEMVQKAATVGITALIAISAPTALAVQTAHELGMVLVAFARGNEFVAYAHADRIIVTD